MNKALTLLGLAGAAVASYGTDEGTGFTYDVIPRTYVGGGGLGQFSYYNFIGTFSANAGVTTEYNPKALGANAPAPDSSEVYALRVFAYVEFTFQHEIMRDYFGQYDFHLDLLDITPYGQILKWSRFDRGDAFALTAQGYRNVDVLNFNTRVRENAVVCNWSAFTSTDLTPTCDYNWDKETDYQDPVWQFDAGQSLINMMDDGDTTTPSWYGFQTWY
jgi:hypothetical protein